MSEFFEGAPYLFVMTGTTGAFMYSIRVSLLPKYSADYVVRAVRKHSFEVLWFFLVTTAGALLLTELALSALTESPEVTKRCVVGFVAGVFCGSGASLLERNMWDMKFVSSFVLRPTSELGFAVLTRLDRSASAFERADNDAWQCQSGYWNVKIPPPEARKRMRLIFEGSKEKLVTETGRSDIYNMDARWHPGNYFFLLLRLYGRKRLRKLLEEPPKFLGLREEWRGEAARKVAGRPEDREDGFSPGDKKRRYDHLG